MQKMPEDYYIIVPPRTDNRLGGLEHGKKWRTTELLKMWKYVYIFGCGKMYL